MGRAKLRLIDVLDGREHDLWIKLKSHKESDRTSGSLHISIQFVEDSPSRIRANTLALQKNEDEHPLFTAVKNGDFDEIKKIITQAKDLNINMKDDHGYTPLHSACCLFSDHDDEILVFLLNQKGIDVNIKNADANTPLHYFCQKFRSPSCLEPFELFIKRGIFTRKFDLVLIIFRS